MDPQAPASDTAAPSAAPAPAAAEPASAPAAPAASPAPAAPATAPAQPTTLLTAAAAAADGEGKPAEAPAPAPADGSKSDDGKGKPAAASTDADLHAPEEYEPFTIEGDSQLDDAFLDTFKPLAKELDLPQAKAQKLAELGAKESQRLAGKFVTDLQQRVDANAKNWETAVKADPELGGAQHEEVMGIAAKALKTFGTPELNSFLLESRLGSNPEVVRLLYRAGKAISQDGAVPGRSTTGTKANADVFYGKS